MHAYIRGVGRQSINVTDDQRVSNYEDEFYVYSPYGLDKSSLFLSQVQIERGPQNVGGRNAAAGSIDMISVRPTDEPYGELRASVGNFGAYNVEGAVSGQVAPGLDMRLSASTRTRTLATTRTWMAALRKATSSTSGTSKASWTGSRTTKFELWARTFYEAWNGRGDAGSRVGFESGSWDQTQLVDANVYPGAGLFVIRTTASAPPSGGTPPPLLGAT